jgi:hypothetical protein
MRRQMLLIFLTLLLLPAFLVSFFVLFQNWLLVDKDRDNAADSDIALTDLIIVWLQCPLTILPSVWRSLRDYCLILLQRYQLLRRNLLYYWGPTRQRRIK